MRPQKIDDTVFMEKVIPLFRSKGYDGTSMQDLSTATGLKKASLYHRFPGGKEEMVHAVITYASKIVKSTIIDVLLADEPTPINRLEKALEGISVYYNQGDASCLLRSLSMGASADLVNTQLEAGMERWIKAFKKIGLDFGFSDDQASQKATQSLILVQGSLVVSKTLKTTVPFENALATIKKLYTK